ncbi:hypothetical protein SPI_04191 [Niveomyces insectorum RCEF 264]|uniref:Luciferase domain-containing protein n=1 Tax=Niveomyces insectorum RCEF 264 TaxID=1081102 RepID=A0A167VIB9_9HYPO|nr:hypothetical protein SPI_04191 [Niveomyces insectorum RCEF 264]
MEICHVHPEGSTHMVFSLGDAYLVVRGGWGERHRLGRRAVDVPAGVRAAGRRGAAGVEAAGPGGGAVRGGRHTGRDRGTEGVKAAQKEEEKRKGGANR